MLKRVHILFMVLCLLFSCKKLVPPATQDNALLDGPVESLNYEEAQLFTLGDAAFNDKIFSSTTGLGPIFVATSCGACHAGDGKGHPSTALVRYGQSDSSGNKYLSLGAPQLQNRAVPGYQPEVLPAGVPFSKILAPANTGLGFLDAVSDADILALVDPQDSNGDGISGVPNWVVPPTYCSIRQGAISVNGRYIARFGKKGATYDLLQQTANAYNQDMGISSTYEPLDTYSKLITDPEVSNKEIEQVVFYLQTLKAPIPRQQNESTIQSGKKLFIAIGCENCHRSELKTGQSKIAALSNKTFYPYTDLLLHDMGSGLDDGYTEGSAKTYEWKTPALWGLGLSKNSQGGSYYLMHDGRAHSIEEAILMHDGEAKKSKQNFVLLNKVEQQNIIQFLESL